MKFINEKFGVLLGYHITLGSVPGKQCVIKIQNTAPYMANVDILLPEEKKDSWYTMFFSAIVRIQDGKNWTLRFDKENVYQYISKELLNRFDKQFIQYPIVIYGGSDANTKANSHSCQMQQKYLAGKVGV